MYLIRKLFSKSRSQDTSTYLEFEEKEHENPEDFKIVHHRMVMEEISKYKDVDLKKIPRGQIKRIGKEFGNMVAASLLIYPNTEECDEEFFEINSVLIKDKRFQNSIRTYFDDHYREIAEKGTKLEAFYRYEMIRYLKCDVSNTKSSVMSVFRSIRQGEAPEIMKKVLDLD